MGKRVDDPVVARVLGGVGAAVEARGFQRLLPASVWTGKFNIASWARTTWKADLVRLGWRSAPTATYFLDAEWSVPLPEGGRLSAAAINAGYRRRGLTDHALPAERGGFFGCGLDGWLAEVIHDAEYAVAWCDGCSTVDGAVAELTRVDRNGPGISSKQYRYILDYVRLHGPAA